MNTRYKRRSAIKLGMGSLAGLATLGLAACDTPATSDVAAAQHTITMRLLFWGTPTRNTLTQQALNLYHQQYPDTTITSNYMTFTPYWLELDRLIAAGQTPDLFQMDMRYLSKYVRREQMLDLTALIYNQTIDLSDFDPLMLAGSKANNSLYGLPLGGNYQCLLYDTVLLEKARVGPLPDDISWGEFATLMEEIALALGKGVFGMNDAGGELAVFEIWIRQHGQELYTVDGQLAFGVTEVAEWFAYWEGLRHNRGCVSVEASAALPNGGGPANSTLIHGVSVFTMPHSNEFESYQALTKHPLALHGMPLGAQAGSYFKPSLLISISSQTPYVKEAASFINFLLNNPNGIKAIGIERGIPGSPRAQTLLRSSFTTAQQQEATFTNMMANSGNVRLKEILDPPAASQVAALFQQVALKVAQKQLSISDGAKAFYTTAQKALQ